MVGWKQVETVILMTLIMLPFSFFVLNERRGLEETLINHERELALQSAYHHQLHDLQRINLASETRFFSQPTHTNSSTSTSTSTSTITGGDSKPEGNEDKSRTITTSSPRPRHRPSLDSLVAPNGTVVGNVQFLLDFAVIGFAKTGSSSLLHWLREHPNVDCPPREIWDLFYGRRGQLVKRLYNKLNPDARKCYKSPVDITEQHILESIRTLFPQAKLFLGIRHPVWWFQSLYNFRVQALRGNNTMPHANMCIGKCAKGMRHTCTDKANYAFMMMRLGKQHDRGVRNATPLESEIINRYQRGRYDVAAVPFMSNEIFLFDTAQLADSDERRREQFRGDVQNFLALPTPSLPPMIHIRPSETIRHDEEIQKQRSEMMMDICQEEYQPLRDELMTLSRHASEWIRSEFLGRKGVFTSSPEYLHEILLSYMDDPCAKNRNLNQSDPQVTSTS